MLSRRRFLVLLGVAGATAGGAALGIAALPGDSNGKQSGPPSIRYGEDACDTCGMVIADVRYASGWRDADGQAARFDDVGCMAVLLEREAPGDGTALYVHDYAAESWLDAATATFVVTPDIKSPMAYGIGAFASDGAARMFATDHSGELLEWGGVVEHMRKRDQT